MIKKAFKFISSDQYQNCFENGQIYDVNCIEQVPYLNGEPVLLETSKVLYSVEDIDGDRIIFYEHDFVKCFQEV